jgi:hypothetical protein
MRFEQAQKCDQTEASKFMASTGSIRERIQADLGRRPRELPRDLAQLDAMIAANQDGSGENKRT